LNLQLRDYQIRLSKEGCEILQRKGLVYLQFQVRTGKTLTALETCKLYGAKKVLFITKIKAFSSIENDYFNFGYMPNFDLTIINKESIHKIETNDFDIVICDESHSLFGTWPKPNNFTKIYKKRFHKIPAILLSGTPSPESYSQLFHQFWINDFAPFKDYKNFYKWADDYVNVKQKRLGYATINDYSEARKKDFWHHIRYNILTFTQQQAGFETNVQEHILEVEMKPITYQIINKLLKDLVVTSKDGKIIMGDTGVKLQQKTHQLFSGTVKFECGTTRVIDDSKAVFIKEKFKGKKIAIFYNFKAELEMLKEVFKDTITTDLDIFNATDKNFAGQIVSCREGISLSKADYLIFLNIQFSAVSYFQAKDRLTTMQRKTNDVYWIFSKDGIESKIYKTVLKKCDYTLSNFKNDFRKKDTIENNSQVDKRRLALSKNN
jgi:hypothetical protein